MSYSYNPSMPSETQVVNTFIDAMARVYLWMTGGLLTTAIVAGFIAQNEALQDVIVNNGWIMLALIVAQFGLIFVISGAIKKLAPGVALGLFFLFSALIGATLSVILLVYDIGTITMAFGVTTALFAGLSVLGLTTKRDLTRWGPILFASLFGLIIASVVNWFLQSSALEWIITYAGVLIFMGLTVYHTKNIKSMTFEALASGDAQAVSRIGVVGALSLYLSFINLFLFILRILGGRR